MEREQIGLGLEKRWWKFFSSGGEDGENGGDGANGGGGAGTGVKVGFKNMSKSAKKV